MNSILILDHEHDAHDNAATLDEYEFSVEIEPQRISAKRLIRDFQFDVLLMNRVRAPLRVPLKDFQRVEVERTVELIKELRLLNVTRPIIVYTSPENDDEACAYLDAGADNYVSKFVSFDVLVARIHSHLRKGRQIDPLSPKNKEERQQPVKKATSGPELRDLAL